MKVPNEPNVQTNRTNGINGRIAHSFERSKLKSQEPARKKPQLQGKREEKKIVCIERILRLIKPWISDFIELYSNAYPNKAASPFARCVCVCVYIMCVNKS